MLLLMRKNFPVFRVTNGEEGESVVDNRRGRWRNRNWHLTAQVVAPEKVKWAVKTFDRYKSPEVNMIYTAFLIEGLDHIIGTLVSILRKFKATGHTPLQWKNVRVVFIPKLGKKSYSDAKDFRPISLSSFFLKTLERLVDRYMREGPLKNFPLLDGENIWN